MEFRKKIIFIFIPLFFSISSVYAASFTNGNFSTGDFSAWSGEIIDVFYNTSTTDPDTSPYFSIVSPENQAEISLDDNYWNNTLYQDFDMDTLLPGQGMSLSFWIKWTPTSSCDGLSAVLSNSSGTDQVNLLSGISDTDLYAGTNVNVDVTSFAMTYGGQQVELDFSLYDMDFDTSDLLDVDNITFTITSPPAPVPEPSTAMLLLLGFVGLGLAQKQKKYGGRLL